jgi:hypothetical protein
MPDQKIVDYIMGQLNAGVDKNKIRSDLMANGSLPSEIDLAFNFVNSQNINTPVSNPGAVSSASPMMETPSASPASKKVITLVGILVLIGVLSASAYVGYNYYKSSRASISTAILNTLEAFSTGKIKSGEFSIVAELNFKDVSKNYSDLATDPTSSQIVGQFQDVAVKMAYSGVVNKTVDNKVETAGDLNLSIKNPTDGTLGMFGPQELSLQYKMFTDDTYFNVTKLPSISAMIIPANIDTTKYLNQWYFMPSTVSSVYSDAYAGDISTTTITTETKEQLVKLFDTSGAFSVVDQKAEQTDKGTAVTAMYIKIDWDKLGAEIIRINQENDKKNGITHLASSDLDIKTNIEKIKELMNTSAVLKLLVGNDGYLYGYVATGDFMDKTGQLIGNYKMGLTGDSYNKTFTIEKPTNAKNFNEVMLEVNKLMSTPVK